MNLRELLAIMKQMEFVWWYQECDLKTLYIGFQYRNGHLEENIEGTLNERFC